MPIIYQFLWYFVLHFHSLWCMKLVKLFGPLLLLSVNVVNLALADAGILYVSVHV